MHRAVAETGRRFAVSVAAACVLMMVATCAAQAAAFSPGAGSPTLTGDNPISTAFSADGHYVAVANLNDHDLSAFSVGVDGSLVPLFGSPIQTGNGPFQVAFSPVAPVLAVINNTDSTVSTYAVASGAVTSTGSASTVVAAHGTSPLSLAYSPGGNLLATADGDGHVTMFNVGLGGTVSPISGSPVTAVSPAPVAMAWSGATIALTNGAANQVSLYSVNAAGVLGAQLSISPLATGINSNPRSVAFSRDGSLLAAGDRDGNAVSLWHMSDGSAVSGSPFLLGINSSPDSVAFSPGSNLLAAGSSDGTTRVFSVGPSGVLSPVAGSPFALSPAGPVASLAFGRAGGLLAVVDEFANHLVILKVDPPAASISVPADGASYLPDQSVIANYSCADAPAAPGIASCTGSVPNGAPLPTGSTGTHTFTVTATSLDGQTTRQTVSYTVGPPHLAMSLTPSRAGAPTFPVPVRFQVSWQQPSGGGVDPSFFLDLPVGIMANTGNFPACASTHASLSRFSCPDSIIASGELIVHNAGATATDCTYDLDLIAVSKPGASVFETIAPRSLGSGAAGTGSAAFCFTQPTATNVFEGPAALKTVTRGKSPHLRLSFSIPVGVLGPTVPNSVKRTPTSIIWHFAVATLSRTPGGGGPKQTPAALLSTSCPKGGWAATLTEGAAAASATVPCTQRSVSKAQQKLESQLSALKAKKGSGIQVSGIVVHTITHANAFVLAKSDGTLYTVHTPGTLPSLSERLTVGVKPLGDGSWLQTCLTTGSGSARSAKLKGVVSFVSQKHHAFVLSAGGTSILIRHAHGKLPSPLYHITLGVGFKNGNLVEHTYRLGRLFNGQLTFVGILKTVGNGTKLPHKTLKMSADDNGTIPSYLNATITGFSGTKQLNGNGTEVEITQHNGAGGQDVFKNPSGNLGESPTLKQLVHRTILDQLKQPLDASAGLACKTGERPASQTRYTASTRTRGLALLT